MADKRLDPEIIFAYWTALMELCDEGNENAINIRELMMAEHNPLDSRPWATNLHTNTWPITSFAATVKARVVKNRMKK